MMPFFTPPGREGDNHRAAGSSNTLLVATLSLLASSAVVALAFWLGAKWLAESAFGLPGGVWVVILISAWTTRLQRNQAGGPSPGRAASDGVTHKAVRPKGTWSGLSSRLRLGLSRFARTLVDAVQAIDGLLARTPLRGLGLDHSWRRRISRMLSSMRLPSLPLRVGFAMSRRRAEQVIDQNPASAEWYMVSREMEPAQALAEHALDVVLTEPAPGVVRIDSLERDGADSSWFDWGVRRPLSYESVFPLRIDPSGVHMDLSSEGELAQSADIVADLVQAVAVLSRHPERLDVQDHVLGRTTSSRWGVTDEFETYSNLDDESTAVMVRLALRVEHRSRSGRSSAADRAAARAVSAWLASWDESIREEQRRSWIEACARVLPEEPEVMLRLAAVRLSAMDDEMGIAALRDADQMLQHEAGISVGDPVAFLQAELEHGPENPMTVARVAAGLCLAIAGVPTERLAFLQEDLLDDMRFATWLVGRDQDRAILMRVLRDLREARERRDALAHGRENPPSQAA